MSGDPDLFTLISRATLEASPQARALGLAAVRLTAREAVMRLPWREELVGDPQAGGIAAGAVTTLLDHVGGQSVWAAMGRYAPIATLDLRIDFTRPPRPRAALLGRARCYALTHALAFVRAAAYEDDPDDPVAAVQAAYIFTGARAGAAEPAAGPDVGA